MYPDINIESNTSENLDILTKKFLGIKFSDKRNIFQIRYKKNLKQINLSINASDKKEDFLFLDDKKIPTKSLGLEFGYDDQGTGYHSSEGVLLAYGINSKNIFKDIKKIDTKNIFHLIKKNFEIKR